MQDVIRRKESLLDRGRYFHLDVLHLIGNSFKTPYYPLLRHKDLLTKHFSVILGAILNSEIQTRNMKMQKQWH